MSSAGAHHARHPLYGLRQPQPVGAGRSKHVRDRPSDPDLLPVEGGLVRAMVVLVHVHPAQAEDEIALEPEFRIQPGPPHIGIIEAQLEWTVERRPIPAQREPARRGPADACVPSSTAGTYTI